MEKERKEEEAAACLAISIYMLSLCEVLSQIGTAHGAFWILPHLGF
jgi:hypothetical protein